MDNNYSEEEIERCTLRNRREIIFQLRTLIYEQLEILDNCLLDLHEAGTLNATLEVRYISPLASRTGKQLWHLGGKFVKLAPAGETLIQRFMARIEAERRALSGS